MATHNNKMIMNVARAVLQSIKNITTIHRMVPNNDTHLL